MTTRSKFLCSAIRFAHSSKPKLDEEGNEVKDDQGRVISEPFQQPTVELSPVFSSDPESENRRFWMATPMGSIQLSINNPAGAELFEVGKEYYVDFTPAG